MLPQIAKLLGVTIDELFCGEEENSPYGEVLELNHTGWNRVAETKWKGTYLPDYGPYTPSEDVLCLFGDVRGKKVLELACGGGESLMWMGTHGVRELWGLDISQVRIAQARKLLKDNGLQGHLFCDQMEHNPGIPQGYFDIVYSIYGLGWTLDLDATFDRVAEYLKPGGTLIFSWDNPLMWCVEAHNGEYFLKRSYTQEEEIKMEKEGAGLCIRNWKISSYLNKLAERGFCCSVLWKKLLFRQRSQKNFKKENIIRPEKPALSIRLL